MLIAGIYIENEETGQFEHFKDYVLPAIPPNRSHVGVRDV